MISRFVSHKLQENSFLSLLTGLFGIWFQYVTMLVLWERELLFTYRAHRDVGFFCIFLFTVKSQPSAKFLSWVSQRRRRHYKASKLSWLFSHAHSGKAKTGNTQSYLTVTNNYSSKWSLMVKSSFSIYQNDQQHQIVPFFPEKWGKTRAQNPEQCRKVKSRCYPVPSTNSGSYILLIIPWPLLDMKR